MKKFTNPNKSRISRYSVIIAGLCVVCLIVVFAIGRRDHDEPQEAVTQSTTVQQLCEKGSPGRSSLVPNGVNNELPECLTADSSSPKVLQFVDMMLPGEMIYLPQGAFAANGALHYLDVGTIGIYEGDDVYTVCVRRTEIDFRLCGGDYPMWIGLLDDPNRVWVPLIG